MSHKFEKSNLPQIKTKLSSNIVFNILSDIIIHRQIFVDDEYFDKCDCYYIVHLMIWLVYNSNVKHKKKVLLIAIKKFIDCKYEKLKLVILKCLVKRIWKYDDLIYLNYLVNLFFNPKDIIYHKNDLVNQLRGNLLQYQIDKNIIVYFLKIFEEITFNDYKSYLISKCLDLITIIPINNKKKIKEIIYFLINGSYFNFFGKPKSHLKKFNTFIKLNKIKKLYPKIKLFKNIKHFNIIKETYPDEIEQIFNLFN